MDVSRDSIASRRLRLHADTLVMPSESGAEIRRGELAHLLGGSNAFELLMRLGQHLDGSRSVAEICANLAEGQRNLVCTVCEWLVERGFAYVVTSEAGELPYGAAVPPPALWIAERTDGSLARFGALRRTRVLVTGDGILPLACVNALSSLYVEHLEVLANTPYLARMKEVLELRAYAPCTLTERAGSLEEALENDGEGYDVVLVCSRHPIAARVKRLAMTCFERRILLLCLSLNERAGIVGPFPARDALACPECFVSTTLEQRGAGWSDETETAPSAREYMETGAAASYLANLAALAVLARMTRMPLLAFEHSVVTIDALSLTRTVAKSNGRHGCSICRT